MGLAEGHSFPHERLGCVGGEHERIRGRGSHPVAVDLEAGHERGQAPQPAARIGPGREDGRLVLLQVAVVRERQTLHRREETRQPADRRSRLAAGELGDVGVQLLRHHRRARGGALGQADEAELARRPEHELLADAREMHVQHRDRIEIVECEVAVGDRVDRVAHLARRRRQPQRRAGERAGSERALHRRLGGGGEPRTVAVEHLDPGEQVVAEGDRLAALEVRVAGDERVGLGLGEREHDERERLDLLPGLRAGVEHVQAEGRGHLVVAGASRVDLAAQLAELPLDGAVHVLVAGDVPGRSCAICREPRLRLRQLLGATGARPRAGAAACW